MCQPGRALTLAPRRARSANGIKVIRHGWHPERKCARAARPPARGGDGSDEERRGFPPKRARLGFVVSRCCCETQKHTLRTLKHGDLYRNVSI
jgi:hypothetical protein